MRSFLLAVQFLTRLPVTVRGEVELKDLARATVFFPAVGFLLGGFAALLYLAASLVFAAPARDLLVILFFVAVTGNMHGDGLMDAADGLASGKDRAGALDVMRDSRVGSHGATAGFLAILAKYVLLGQIPAPAKVVTLLAVPALGRWAQVYAAAVCPYARPAGGTASFVNLVGTRELLLASATLVGGLALLLGVRGGLLAVMAWGSTALVAYYATRRIGGVTGDILGAINEGVELAALLVLGILI